MNTDLRVPCGANSLGELTRVGPEPTGWDSDDKYGFHPASFGISSKEEIEALKAYALEWSPKSMLELAHSHPERMVGMQHLQPWYRGLIRDRQWEKTPEYYGKWTWRKPEQVEQAKWGRFRLPLGD